MATLLQAEGVTKRFGGVAALSGVHLDIQPGEVHALMGANGAGKSTLIKVLCGVHRADEGRLVWQGTAVHFRDLRDAMSAGIAVMFQQLNVVEALTVGEYLTLGRERSRFGFIDKRGLLKFAQNALDRLGISLALDRPAASLSVAERELLEIARAMSLDARLVIMDEPTASLGGAEVEHLFAVIRRLRASGVSVLYVSHRLDEVLAIADRSTVLRDGRNVGELVAAETTKDRLLELMVGRQVVRHEATHRDIAHAPVLEVTRLATEAGLAEIDLDLHRGEVLGLYGLMGAGRTELLRAIYGLDRLTAGSMRLDGRDFAPDSPHAAMQAGIGLVPEDRIREAVIPDASVAANITLAAPATTVSHGVFSARRERSVAQSAVTRIGIKVPGVNALMPELSGGNQQKVIIGRWLVRGIRVLLLDDPTVGVDVAAKQDIYRLIHEATATGMAVIVASSELEELMQLSDRILVMHRKRIVAATKRSLADADAIVRQSIEGAAQRLATQET